METNNNMESKSKYTNFGELPRDWDVLKLSQLISENFIIGHLDGNHGSLYPRTYEFVNDGVPYLSANSLEKGLVNFNMAKYLSQDRASKFKKGIAKNRDVLFAHNATVGPVALLKTNKPKIILSTTLTYYRCNEKKLSPEFLVQFMQSSYFTKQYKMVMKQSTRNQIPITLQRELFHIVPKLEEQQKIATILSIWDKAIDLKEKLIEQKKEQKKGLMRKLLTGEVRLLGFDGEWISKPMSKCITAMSGYPFKSSYFNENGDGMPLIRIRDIKSKEITTYYSGEFNKNYIIEKGDVIIGMDGEFNITMWDKEDGLLNQRVMKITPKEGYDLYFLYQLLIPKLKKLELLMPSTTVKHLSIKDVNGLKVKVPSFKEQKEIGKVLFKLDKEISLLKENVEYLILQKKGLMQLLLTGKVRVKV